MASSSEYKPYCFVPGAPNFLGGSAETHTRVSWVLWIYQRDKNKT
jgi:hypothetical protein